jgi:tetratricopeptide (TPR) repeat protein
VLSSSSKPSKLAVSRKVCRTPRWPGWPTTLQLCTGIRFATLTSQGRYAHAEPLYLEALRVRRETSASSTDIAESLNSLGCLKQDQGRLVEAQAFFEEGLSLRLNAFGSVHVDVAVSYTNLAGLFGELSRYQLAKEYSQKAVDLYTAICGPTHPFSVQARAGFAGLLQETGEYAEAEAIYRECIRLKATKTQDRRGCAGTGAPRYCLLSPRPRYCPLTSAVILHRVEDYARAEEAYKRGLDIRLKALGRQHPDTAASYNALGVLCRDLGPEFFPSSRSYLNQAINIVEVMQR